MSFFKIFLILPLFISINIFANSSFIIVVSENSNLVKLSKSHISKLFLSKIKSFPNGEKAIPIELNNKEYRTTFYKTLTNKNKKQLSKYWAKMIFTGKGIPPKKFENISELIEFVKNNKNAITYLKKEYLTKELKIIGEIN